MINFVTRSSIVFSLAGSVQLLGQCTFAVTPDSLDFKAGRATKELKIVASVTGCSVPGGGPVPSTAWLHVGNASTNNNVSKFAIVADANTGAARTATIAVVGQTVPVTQSAGSGAPPAGPSPTITPEGIVNSASFLNGGLAPGEIVSLFGKDLGPDPLVVYQIGADHVTLPTAVGATQVFFNDEAAPIIFSSSGQVSAIVPYTISDSTVVKVRVEFGSTQSNTVNMPVSPSAPAFFTIGNAATGQGAFLNKDNTVNSAQNPAHAGDFVELYGTGGGLSSPAFSAQTLSPSAEPLPRLQLPVTVTVGGRSAKVTYAGGVPGAIPGLMQVNVQLPADVPTGNSVPVVMTIGAGTAPTATIAIQ